jgi:hypothetical protein
MKLLLWLGFLSSGFVLGINPLLENNKRKLDDLNPPRSRSASPGSTSTRRAGKAAKQEDPAASPPVSYCTTPACLNLSKQMRSWMQNAPPAEANKGTSSAF